MKMLVSFLPPRLTCEEYRFRLETAGISSKAIQGILQICTEGNTLFKQYGDHPTFHDAIESVTKLFIDLETFIKTQSKDDQVAYATVFARRGAEYKK